MAAEDSFCRLMARVRSGEDEATREVFERFSDRLVALARRRFNRALARKVDPEDVVQSAYKSFFVRHAAGKLEVGGWEGLWHLLTVITLRKCADRVEYFRAGRRDVAREATFDDGPDAWHVALDREPRPEEAAMLAETVERLFRDANEHERPILELSLQGYTTPEISVRIGRAERSVRRLRENIRKRLERLHDAE